MLLQPLPAVWRNMKPVLCCKVVEVVNGFYKAAEQSGVDVCLKLKNIKSLTHYVTLNDVTKLRICYLAVKKDDSVFGKSDKCAYEIEDEEKQGESFEGVDAQNNKNKLVIQINSFK